MDAIRAQLARMQQQLGQLTASQRMLAASLVAVMVLTLMFWGRYAGTADYEPLLDQPFSGDDIPRITSAIAAKGIPYKVVGDRIHVPADRKLELVAAISYEGLAPSDTHAGYEKILQRLNLWSSQAESEATRNDAMARLVSDVIKMMPPVREAIVIIDPTTERNLSGRTREPTASVQIITKDPRSFRDVRKLVEAAAVTVMGAKSSLNRKNINVVIDGVPYRVQDNDSMGIAAGEEILAKEQAAQEFYEKHLRDQLSFLGRVIVSVRAEVNVESEKRTEVRYPTDGVVSKEKEIETETNEETAAAPTNGDVGVEPNAALSIDPQGSAGAGSNSIKERNSTKMENRYSQTTSEKSIPAGQARPVSASVRVPRSYFVALFKNMNGSSSKEPDDKALEPLLTEHLAQIRQDVKQTVAIQSDANISVQMYHDSPLVISDVPSIAGVAGSAGASGKVSAMLTTHVKEIAIGVLAVISLFMVSSMVKKSSPAPIITAAMELGEAPALSDGEHIAGDVSEGNATLDGVEMDEDSIKAQQMVEQVSVMVKENPDGAANLVKRWLNRT